MKLFIITDTHFCENSSIVRGHGNKYTKRLENCIQTQNWAERKAEELSCDYIIHLGDYFDKSNLTDQEITAAQDIEWSQSIKHIFLVGNHESGDNNLQYSSTKILQGPGREVIFEPENRDFGDVELCFLPYVVEYNRRPIEEYFGAKSDKTRIILSHNDINGIQLGPVISKSGFYVEEIENNCDLFINGHLHNGQQISEVILNLGNITGKDFGENAAKYSHRAILVDTDSGEAKYIENPYAYNFYKIDIDTEEDIQKLDNLKNNAVLSLKVKEQFVEAVNKKLASLSNIIDTRLVTVREIISDNQTTEEVALSLGVDHITKFTEYCRANSEMTPVLEAELAEVCK